MQIQLSAHAFPGHKNTAAIPDSPYKTHCLFLGSQFDQAGEQSLEDRIIRIQILRMPLNGINQAVLALQRLGNAIVGAAYDPQALAHFLDSLMMERVGIDLLAQDLAQHTFSSIVTLWVGTLRRSCDWE